METKLENIIDIVKWQSENSNLDSIWLLCRIVEGDMEIISSFSSKETLLDYIEDYRVSNFGYYVLEVPLNPKSEVDKYLSVEDSGIEIFDLEG